MKIDKVYSAVKNVVVAESNEFLKAFTLLFVAYFVFNVEYL